MANQTGPFQLAGPKSCTAVPPQEQQQQQQHGAERQQRANNREGTQRYMGILVPVTPLRMLCQLKNKKKIVLVIAYMSCNASAPL